jgi:hypothetical protein
MKEYFPTDHLDVEKRHEADYKNKRKIRKSNKICPSS